MPGNALKYMLAASASAKTATLCGFPLLCDAPVAHGPGFGAPWFFGNRARDAAPNVAFVTLLDA